jgi:hypothetical protein
MPENTNQTQEIDFVALAEENATRRFHELMDNPFPYGMAWQDQQIVGEFHGVKFSDEKAREAFSGYMKSIFPEKFYREENEEDRTREIKGNLEENTEETEED